MKKIIAAMIALAAVSSAAYASPLTTYQKGQTEINVGMWDASAKSNGYKSDGEWNFTGGLTYGINDKWAALECKQHAGAKKQPNQEYYVGKMDEMSFSRFICPENKEEVLHDLQQSFQS